MQSPADEASAAALGARAVGAPGERTGLARADSSARAEAREVVKLAWPIVIAQLGLVAMGLVDTAILGRVSATELAGAAMGRSLGFGAVTLAFGIAAALEPLAAQAIGAGEPTRAWRALASTTIAALAFWAPLTIAGYLVTFALEPLGVQVSLVAPARDYFVMQAPGLALGVVFYAAKTFLQAHGRTRPALVASVVANVVNFVVCNLLVRGDDALVSVGLRARGLPPLGARGAGIAFSVATLVLVVIVALALAPFRRAAHSSRDGGSAASVPIIAVVRLGLPIGMQMFVEAGVFSVASLIVGRFGAAVTAAHQIALALTTFTYMGALGVSGAAAVRVGHAVGAGMPVRQRGLVAIAVGGAFMALCALVFVAAPRFLISIFSDEAAVVALGARLLFIVAVFQLFDGVQTVAAGALRGAGDVRFGFFANLVAHWLVAFPIGYALAFWLGYGIVGMWWGLTLGLVIVAVALVSRFLRLSRRTIQRVE